MAEITIAPGVTRADGLGWWILTGTMDALIASGLVKVDCFPNGVDCNNRGQVLRKKLSVVDGRKIDVRRPARGHCIVYFHRTPDERAEYEEVRAREERQECAADRSRLIELKEKLELQHYADALGTPDGLKSLVWKEANVSFILLGRMFGLIDSYPAHWSFSRKVKDRAKHLLAELADLYAKSEMTPTRGIQARADTKFQTFLQSVAQR